jgi:thioredoxin reductase (NADPH)
MGPEMMEDLKKQAARFGADIRYGIATKVDFSGCPHKITIDETIELTADAVIIATGASAKWLGLPSEARLNGSGVSACAVCDGFFYRGKEVAIVGAGDTAAEEASYLANLCSKVYMLVRKDAMRASKIMQKRVLENPKIEVLFDTATEEILGEHAVEAVRVKNLVTHETRELPIHGFFVAIGHEPNSKIFQDYLHHDEQGYLKTLPGTAKTNVDGVFACGDVQDFTYRQAITAAGTGCMAALDAERYLAGLKS